MSAALAVKHGACPRCTTDRIQVWHTDDECKRIDKKQVAS